MENKKKEIAKFYEQIFSYTKLKEKIVEKAKAIVNKEDLKKLIQQEIVPLMKKYNVNFSEKELLEYEEETLKKLSKDDLENVSGGTLIKPVAIGALSALALAYGVGVTSLSASADFGKGALIQTDGKGQQQSDGNEEEEEEEANISENDNENFSDNNNNETYQIIASGNCGPEGDEESVIWKFLDNGILEILGNGPMKDFSLTGLPPWRLHKDKIRYIYIRRGITHIGSYAFIGHSEVESVFIEATVTSTGQYAFANCKKLTSVFFHGERDLDPDNNKKIFANCPINAIMISGDYEYGDTFCGLSTCLVYGSNAHVLKIGVRAPDDALFLPCDDYEISMPMPSDELSIPYYIEVKPTGKFIEGVTKRIPIMPDMSPKLSPLDKIIASGQESEGVLWVLHKSGTLDVFGDVSMENYSDRERPQWEQYKDKIKRIVISGAKSIGDNAFANYKELRLLEISNNVVSIGKNAFNGCNKLSVPVGIPASVTSIGEHAFANCTKLNSVFFEGKNDLDPNNDKKVFANCPIEEIKVTDAYIGGNTFCGKRAIKMMY